MQLLSSLTAILLLASASGSAPITPLVIDADKPIAVLVNDNLLNALAETGTEKALSIALETGGIDRLTLHPQTIARLGIKPAYKRGNASFGIGLTRLLTGRYRPMALSIEGVPQRARVFWFEGAVGGRADGSIGPWAMPQNHIAIRLGGPGRTLYRFPLTGSPDSQSYTIFKHDGGKFGLSFAVEDLGRYPVASAAAGAAIAKAYNGFATEEVWEKTISFGIRRPVRLVKLGRPLVIGPFSFSEIAVRIRDRRDGSGTGDPIPTPPTPQDDPSEILVTARSSKAPRPTLSLTISRASLQQCSSLDYIKSTKDIRLYC